jgi:hypothetical protein
MSRSARKARAAVRAAICEVFVLDGIEPEHEVALTVRKEGFTPVLIPPEPNTECVGTALAMLALAR